MRLSEPVRRLAIFAFYDADGIVDGYIPYLLRAVGACCTEQIAVVNGPLSADGEAALRACCTRLIRRPNEGFDITGYKEAFLSLEHPEAYDEILFYNQTVFGPVCSPAPMFAEMAARDVDFWGLTKHRGADAAAWDTSVVIPPHLQSFFFAVRSRMFLAPAFRRYWAELPAIRTYWDAVGLHEIRFTAHFAQLGFRWAPYLDTADLEPVNDYPLMGMPAELLRRGCPFVKRKSFLLSALAYSSVPQGAAAAQALDWIGQNTDYPPALITENLTRTAAIADITRALFPCYDPAAQAPCAQGTAVVLWFAQATMADALCRAAQACGAGDAVFAVFADPALADACAPQLPAGAKCRVSARSGLAELFGPLWAEVSAFPAVLYLNNGLPGLLDTFADATTLDAAVQDLAPARCAGLLRQRPWFGAVLPLPPVHQETLSAGQNWPAAAAALEQGLAAAGIRVPVKTDLAGLAGLAARGSLFYARTEAVAPLHAFPFSEELFAGLYPAAEYLVPLAVQSTGSLIAFAAGAQRMQAGLAVRSALLDAVLHRWATPAMVRSDQVLFRMDGILDFYEERHDQMTLEQAFHAKLTARQKLWICLQILLKPETFARLHRLTGHGSAGPQPDPKP
jgi:hypothetical protein